MQLLKTVPWPGAHSLNRTRPHRRRRFVQKGKSRAKGPTSSGFGFGFGCGSGFSLVRRSEPNRKNLSLNVDHLAALSSRSIRGVSGAESESGRTGPGTSAANNQKVHYNKPKFYIL